MGRNLLGVALFYQNFNRSVLKKNDYPQKCTYTVPDGTAKQQRAVYFYQYAVPNGTKMFRRNNIWVEMKSLR